MSSGFGVRYDPTIGFALQRPFWTLESMYLRCATADWSDMIELAVHLHDGLPVMTHVY